MSKGGIAPRTAQAAMRHSKIDLTMSVYTDPKLLDVRGALDVLPALPLDGGPAAGEEAARATGTDGLQRTKVQALAPTLAPTPDLPGQAGAFPVISAGGDGDTGREDRLAASASEVKRKHPPTGGVSGRQGMGAIGLEPMTPSVSSWCSSQLS